MRLLFLVALSFCTLFAKDKEKKLFPKYDKRVDGLSVHHAPVDPIGNKEHEQYFHEEVPRLIHQIWFGNPNKMPKEKVAKWAEYAKENKLIHKLWSENDLSTLQSMMEPQNYNLLLGLLEQKNYTAASDVVRLELLKQIGGCYFDCDFSPPSKKKAWINLEQIFCMRGLTVVTEHQGRNIGETALFVCNGIILSPPSHPVIVSACEQLTTNTHHWYQKNRNHDAMFCTGPFFFNKVLWGTFNVVPLTYLNSFYMY